MSDLCGSLSIPAEKFLETWYGAPASCGIAQPMTGETLKDIILYIPKFPDYIYLFNKLSFFHSPDSQDEKFLVLTHSGYRYSTFHLNHDGEFKITKMESLCGTGTLGRSPPNLIFKAPYALLEYLGEKTTPWSLSYLIKTFL